MAAAFLLFANPACGSEETVGTTNTTPPNDTKTAAEGTTSKYAKFDAANEDWGSYYDPKNIFCGKYDCYKILGFDYESFGKQAPSAKEITQRYRSLGREWHPDKSKHKNAKERFVKIIRAYEILNDPKQKKEYDDLRYNQEAYFRKYGSNVLYDYAPKSNVWFVVGFIMIMLHAFSYFLQYNKWQRVADKFVLAVVQDWTVKEGGSIESKALRERALTQLAAATAATPQQQPPTNGTSNKKQPKLSAKEQKRLEMEQLTPIVKAIVYQEMHDFGAGFHKPTYRDLLIVAMIRWPITVTSAVVWQVKYMFRRLSNQMLNEEEQLVLTQRAVGHVYWSTADEATRQSYVTKQLWKKDNYAAWKEEMEFAKLPAAEQKYLLKEKKRLASLRKGGDASKTD
jgi:DnaJ homolog subfamily C member 25